MVLAIAFSLALLLLIIPGALAQEPTPEATAVPARPPLGDCYGGVLSHTPLHCYALEQAEAAGVIDVDSIYLAGARLYVFVGGDAGGVSAIAVEWGNPTAGLAVYEGIGEEMKEYARIWPDLVDIRKTLWPDVCESGDSNAECLVTKIETNFSAVEFILDDIDDYDSLYLRAGTGEDRNKVRGWRAWAQLWPDVLQEDSGRDEPASSFDVSDVDTTNFPSEVNCFQTGTTLGCMYWQGTTTAGINGAMGGYKTDSGFYIQLWQDPNDSAAFEVEKAKILEAARRKVVIVPVKYDFQELWEWGVILARFTESKSNTIGVLYAGVSNNSQASFARSALGLYRQPDSGGSWVEGIGTNDYSLVRETVAIIALDPYVVRNALPTLLPQLGIPIDAVGIILRPRQTVEYHEPDIGSQSNLQDTDTGGKVESASGAKADDTSDEAIPDTAANTGSERADTLDRMQNAYIQSPYNVHAAQTGSLATDDQSAPSMVAPMPDAEDGSMFSPWVLTLVAVAFVAMALLALGLAKNRLRHRDF